MYEVDHADVYDLFYLGRGKDYAAEAAAMAELVRSRTPGAASLLDVACGTGTHLEHFVAQFAEAEGLELSADMLRHARSRIPDVRLHQEDMRDFRLGRTFDAVVSMFSSVGYLRTTAELDGTLRTFAAHLAPGGVVVVEPWWFPETFIEGWVSADVVRKDDRTVARVSHSVREGNATRLEEHFTVADSGLGIRHFSEVHLITLFHQGEYEKAFETAGLRVEYLEGGPSGRGLFVGVPA
ncbi:class I SAM-dependent methyltransferase [Streptomyces sp. RY43-2]|uniref:Class I SAM-dependent methyltransferase n=1 Tax=Streptomyces macrolidinus TaxID=2952607 RepID=A0ABT0ZLE2_9ACTN|nr:class I SAM-dependent methyltransferase [Streptomyces macrolidinus]MCN9244371.1 class I SAM-dependent methyltransferase [Streptomyces macrolidinus]